MNQTIVKYGAVSIYHCLTTRFEQRPEYDPSGADPMFQRFTIAVIGYVHGKDTEDAYVQSAPQGDNAAETYQGIGEILGAPRLQFRYIVGADDDGSGGVTVFDVSAGANDGTLSNESDVNNGPRCLQFNVHHVVANEIWKVEATFEICIPNCARGGNNDARVLSNKWSVTDGISKDRMLTRTYQGRLRVSSGKLNPNSFRGLVVPVLVPGMRRETMDFQASADGLWLHYTIVDTEAAYSAPHPATSWEIVHSERTGMSALVGEGDISVSMTGDRNVDRKALIALGLKIMNDRLRFGLPLLGNPDHYIADLIVTDYLGSEGPLRVNVSAKVKHSARGQGNDLQNNIIFARAKLGTPIDGNVLAGYDPNRSRDGRPGEQPETSGPVPLVGAFVTYLQTVCSNVHDIGQNQDTTLIDPRGRSGSGPTIITGTVVQQLPDEAPEYIDQSQSEAMYLNYRMESKYDTDMHRVPLPIADDPSRVTSGSQQDADTVAVITLAPPGSVRTMRVQASRIGREPELPEPVDQYEDEGNIAVLLRAIVQPSVPGRLGDGKQYLSVEAEYRYALKRAVKAKDRVRIGVNPWETSGLYRASERMVGAYSEDTKSGSGN